MIKIMALEVDFDNLRANLAHATNELVKELQKGINLDRGDEIVVMDAYDIERLIRNVQQNVGVLLCCEMSEAGINPVLDVTVRYFEADPDGKPF
jgi:hypothetical protein